MIQDIAIGSDHAGIELKKIIKSFLKEQGYTIVDFGTENDCSVDYPDYGEKVASVISCGEFERGILICGTGLGMCIVANKFPRIRAALCYDIHTAKMSRLHNDSNILVLGGRVIKPELACEIVKIWIDTPFEGGRHQRRLEKIKLIEEKVRYGL